MQHITITNTKQVTLRFILPRSYSSEEFRVACSTWLDWMRNSKSPMTLTCEELSSLFHHDHHGRPIMGVPLFRFQAAGHHGYIHGIGQQGADILTRLHSSLERLPPPLPWIGQATLGESVVSTQYSKEAIAYWIPNLIICKNAEQYKRWKSSSESQCQEHVADIIRRGIERQINALDMIDDAPKLTPRIDRLANERAVPRLHGKEANALVRVATVAFTMNSKLVGHWAAGGLTNRGYGRISALSLPSHVWP